MRLKLLRSLFIGCAIISYSYAQPKEINLKDWELSWSDEFNGSKKDIRVQWSIENGDGVTSHIHSNRWDNNIEVKDGSLRLVNRRKRTTGIGSGESRCKTHEFTSGNMWTKRDFMYGYYECRFKYAASNAINNAFWFMNRPRDIEKGKRYEIDVNEGHYPNEINMNLHNWSDIDEDGKHPIYPLALSYGTKPGYSYQLEKPFTTSKVRIISNYDAQFHIPEFRVYNVNSAGYPDPLSATADSDIEGLVNYARDACTKVKVSGIYKDQNWRAAPKAHDGSLTTTWLSQDSGEKWIELTFDQERTVGCVQFVNGIYSAKYSEWRNQINDFKVQYHDGSDWVNVGSLSKDGENLDLSRDFHTYGFEWNEKELIYYFDGVELYRLPNEFCYTPSAIRLSTAVISWSGPMNDPNLDGSFMEVDYIRYYTTK